MGLCSCFCNILNGFFKYIIFLFNLIFVLAGITILVLGVLMEVQVLDLSQYIDINIHTSAIILMVAGGIVILVAFLGCCGAISNNRCFLNLYASLLLVALCLQVAGFVLVIVWNPSLSVDLENEMKKLMVNYDSAGETGNVSRTFWDTLQKTDHCCGIYESNDWKDVRENVPDSCKCENSSFACDNEGFYLNGCYTTLKDSIFIFQYVMAWIALGIVLFELVIARRRTVGLCPVAMACVCQFATPRLLEWSFYVTLGITSISSLAAIVFAAVIIQNVSSMSEFFNSEDAYPATFVLSTQCLTFFFGAWALLGVCKQSACSLYTTAFFHFLLSVLQVVGIVGTFVRKNLFRGGLLFDMENLASRYFLPNYGGDSYAKFAWDKLQINHYCCGIREPSDWSTYRPEMQGLPTSCVCSDIDKHCGDNNTYQYGCYATLEPFMIQMNEAMGAMAIITVIFQVASAVLSIKLVKALRRQDSVAYSLID
ncbi:Hypothetical predicted protein [Cloeon dipterum]|uniref:Tetraspanin n=1 Tax=Cloeon dipterum TaxID=197152 RepID=A0A8S1CMT5_9INSE|nr:Hypothetical predicted protein [Cloeon dipterum]